MRPRRRLVSWSARLAWLAVPCAAWTGMGGCASPLTVAEERAEPSSLFEPIPNLVPDGGDATPGDAAEEPSPLHDPPDMDATTSDSSD